MVQCTVAGVGSPRQGRAGPRQSSRDEDFCVPHLRGQGLSFRSWFWREMCRFPFQSGIKADDESRSGSSRDAACGPGQGAL